jgi:phosphoenolpyruvate carboxykinase (ATP)
VAIREKRQLALFKILHRVLHAFSLTLAGGTGTIVPKSCVFVIISMPSRSDLLGTSTDQLDRLAAAGVEAARVHRNLSVAALYEAALSRGEATLTADGALSCLTGAHTGRSPRDKFFVREHGSEKHISWGAVNVPISEAHYSSLEKDLLAYLRTREVFVQDCSAGADPRFDIPVRVITERAWHGLFARNLFRMLKHRPDRAPFTIIDAPGFRAIPVRHGTRTETCIIVNLAARRVLIGGTSYAGEIKKSVFTILNYLLPFQNVLPMHCSANVGADGDVALFFGLSGTGKTTIASDATRRLIGDDEHGWSDDGVFNFEGGCYAKLIRLSAAAEPQIFSAVSRFGAVLENVVLDGSTRVPDFDAAALTENTRGAYPLGFIPSAVPSGVAGHPRAIIMLTADAFGVLPPIARLTASQAMYHFLSGYTARVAGTETGVTEPAATFSTCFGAPFLPLRPGVYANFLGRRLSQHGSSVWLVNTGWTGGPYGVGQRMPLAYTRAMVAAALDGRLDRIAKKIDPVFGVAVPAECPGVPTEMLDPRSTWQDASSYDAQARKVAAMFAENFTQFAADVAPEVAAAGPA